jgi:glyoxylase-like metal-dependent hydrolase (beta-lactamase superfamily II)
MNSVEPRFFTTSLLPVRERLVLRGGRWQRVLLRVRVGCFHHPQLGYTLIDTGFSARLARPERGRSFYLSLYRSLIRPSTLSAGPLGEGLRRLGLGTTDINTVILTHLHADHVSGLADLPQARILCPAAAWSAFRSRGASGNAREGVFAELLPSDFESRLTLFEAAAKVEAPKGLGMAFDLAGDGSVLICRGI